MTVEYTIRSYPTTYKGIRFRSRLEATWAAFFDLLEWPWEYEPFDLGEWSPDFLLMGRNFGTLVEVNPTQDPDSDVLIKMERCSPENYRLLYCGVTPSVVERLCMMSFYTNCCPVGDPNCPHGTQWGKRLLIRANGSFDLVFGHDPYEMMISGENGDCYDLGEASYFDGDVALARWREAKNKIQWRAPR